MVAPAIFLIIVVLSNAGDGNPVHSGGIVKLPGVVLSMGGLNIVQHHMVKAQFPHQRIPLGNGLLFGDAAPVFCVPSVFIIRPFDVCRRPVSTELIENAYVIFYPIYGSAAADLLGIIRIIEAVDDWLLLRGGFDPLLVFCIQALSFFLFRLRGIRIRLPFRGIDVVDPFLQFLFCLGMAIQRLPL